MLHFFKQITKVKIDPKLKHVDIRHVGLIAFILYTT